jgi:hypothetical protein
MIVICDNQQVINSRQLSQALHSAADVLSKSVELYQQLQMLLTLMFLGCSGRRRRRRRRPSTFQYGLSGLDVLNDRAAVLEKN